MRDSPATRTGGARVLDAGRNDIDAAVYAAAIASILDGQVAEMARDRNSACYRVELRTNGSLPQPAIVKIVVPGPQRTNPDTSFAGEAGILARLPAAGLAGAPILLARVALDEGTSCSPPNCRGPPASVRHPLDPGRLESILDGLQAMDESGLMHYDLKSANILVDDDRAAFIDFEFARFEDCRLAYAPEASLYCDDFNVSANPFFPSRSNVANFEFRTLHRYLVDLGTHRSPGEADELLCAWLIGRSRYHELRAEWLAELRSTSVERILMAAGVPSGDVDERLLSAVAYERLLAELYAQPRDEIRRVERSLLAFRCATFERSVEAALPGTRHSPG